MIISYYDWKILLMSMNLVNVHKSPFDTHTHTRRKYKENFCSIRSMNIQMTIIKDNVIWFLLPIEAHSIPLSLLFLSSVFRLFLIYAQIYIHHFLSQPFTISIVFYFLGFSLHFSHFHFVHNFL